MNLNENIYRINTLIYENKRGVIIKNLIDKVGVVDAIKMVGNYHTIEPYLKVIDKVNFIKEKVYEISEALGGGSGISLEELYEQPIFYCFIVFTLLTVTVRSKI